MPNLQALSGQAAPNVTVTVHQDPEEACVVNIVIINTKFTLIVVFIFIFRTLAPQTCNMSIPLLVTN